MANFFYPDIEDYQNVQQKRIDNVLKLKRKTPINAAKYMTARARQMAPRKTGNLIRNIIRRGNQVRISGSNPLTGFPYVHWINQSKGYKVLRVGRYTNWKGVPMVSVNGNWVPVEGGRMVYGSAPANWVWTGTPRFATIARNDAREYFKKAMIRDTAKAINLTG
jgi:hypothetical protein